jgi:DNA-binding transcriptional ArsR family regulator
MVELDGLIHQPTRLRIMAALVALDPKEKVEFSFLRDMLGLTDGNLSAHLRVLEEAAYVSVEKGFVGRRPRTWVQANRTGRRAFEDHVAALETIIRKGTSGP